jgi:hypothetical protein
MKEVLVHIHRQNLRAAMDSPAMQKSLEVAASDLSGIVNKQIRLGWTAQVAGGKWHRRTPKRMVQSQLA